MSKLSQLMAAHMALLSATAGHKNPFGIEYYRRKDDYGSVPTDKQKCRPKEQHEFTIKGVKIIASSKKDAIKKYNHRKK